MGVNSVGSGGKAQATPQPKFDLATYAMKDLDNNGRVSTGDLPAKEAMASPETLGKALAQRPEKYILLGDTHDAQDPKTQIALFKELKAQGTPFIYAVELPQDFKGMFQSFNSGKTSEKEFIQDFDFMMSMHSDFKGEGTKEAILEARRQGGNIGIVDASSRESAAGGDRDVAMARKILSYNSQLTKGSDGKLRSALPANGKLIAALGTVHVQENITPGYRKVQTSEANQKETYAPLNPNPAAKLLADQVGKDQVLSVVLYPANISHVMDSEAKGTGALQYGAHDYVIPRQVNAEWKAQVSNAVRGLFSPLTK